jgi:hypothetical protein
MAEHWDTSYPSVVSSKYTASCRTSHGPVRARINASGSSTDSFAIPSRVPATIRASCVDRVRSLDVPHLFPSLGSAGRRFASLHRVLRGEFPCFDGSIKALRLPAAHPAALRCLRLAVPQRPLVRFAPRRTSAPPRPGVGHPVSPAGVSTEETTESPRFPGNPDCPFAMFSRRRQDCWHQTSTVPQRGPWFRKCKGSHIGSFDAQ